MAVKRLAKEQHLGPTHVATSYLNSLLNLISIIDSILPYSIADTAEWKETNTILPSRLYVSQTGTDSLTVKWTPVSTDATITYFLEIAVLLDEVPTASPKV